MFNSKKEFALALLSGRKFTMNGKDLLYYDERPVNPFRYCSNIDNEDENGTMNGYWPYFDNVIEVFTEPRQGDLIKVKDHNMKNSVLGIFITMYNGKFLCKKESDNNFWLYDERVG